MHQTDSDITPRRLTPDLDHLSTPLVLSSPTAVVYSDYDVSHPPPIPGPGWTRFVCISDTHSRTFPVPPGDVLLHGGDLTQTGSYSEFSVTMNWLRGLPHPIKIIIAGNHDVTLDQTNDWYNTHFHRWHRTGKENVAAIRKLLEGRTAKRAGIIYLEDQGYQFQTKKNGKLWTVYGSPWSPQFFDWAFNYRRGSEQAERVISAIPKADILYEFPSLLHASKVDILYLGSPSHSITHTPPHQIMDKTRGGYNVGCEALYARLPELRPRLHVFGHIHEDHGSEIREWPSQSTAAAHLIRGDGDGGTVTESRNDSKERTVFVNAANWPQGTKAWTPSGQRVPFGRGPYGPVIVDLLDAV